MQFTAKQIAEFLQGDVVGNPDVTVSDVSRIEEGRPGTLSFLSNPKYTEHVYTTKSSIVLVNRSFEPQHPVQATMIRVDNAYDCLAQLLQLVEAAKPKKSGISSLAYISETAQIGNQVYIGPFAYIGENVSIGDNTQIYPHVFVDDNTTIGQDCIIKAGTRIGDGTQIGNRVVMQAGVACGFDGFGFAPKEDGTYDKLPQVGNVVIEDDVEIQSNTCIDRATIGSTILRRGVKVDNLVQIAHNVEVGESTVLAAQNGIAGSTKLGKHIMSGGKVGFGGHITVADNCVFGASSSIANNIRQTGAYQGLPAIPIMTFRKSAAVYKNLADIQRIVYDLKRKMDQLDSEK
ncbi:MAG: UDP-3-O-(3-hydroxymyristoyl)glucosamine N-acyltransferase [Paludibacteraceae bacterium]|nr:UDP-3-O-(3-hydroxymyristoyl)glucosamine N-acyltransferase [Paludibacteraceae bacterium]